MHSDPQINSRSDMSRMELHNDRADSYEQRTYSMMTDFLNAVYNKPKDAPVDFSKRPVWDATQKVGDRQATIEEVALESLDYENGPSTWMLIEYVRKNAIKNKDAEAMAILASMALKFAQVEVDV